MILGQPGKKEIRQRCADGLWAVYRFDPKLETTMQWEIIGLFPDKETAAIFAFPHKIKNMVAA
jgi:hypothetical protein